MRILVGRSRSTVVGVVVDQNGSETLGKPNGEHYAGRLLLDGAFLIAFGTGVLYFYELIHHRAYYQFFGLSLSYVGSTRDQILPQGALIAALAVSYTLVTIFGIYRRPRVFGWLADILVIGWPLISFTLMTIGLVRPELLAKPLEDVTYFLLFSILLSAFAVIVGMSVRYFAPDFTNTMRRYGIATLTILLGLYLLWGVGAAHTSGVGRATNKQEGSLGGAISLTLVPESPMQSVIEGKQLILISSSDERYYLVERISPSVPDPPVYILEKSQVAGAEIYRFDSD